MDQSSLLRQIKEGYESAYRRKTQKSLEAIEDARKYMPGGESRGSVWIDPYPLWCDEAEGCRIKDLDGNEYIDFHNCWTAMVLGHGNPKVKAAIATQLEKGATAMGVVSTNLIHLAKHLRRRVESIDKIRFANSGTEAILMAIRIARAFTGKEKILKTEWGYHGFYDPVEYPSDINGLPKSVFNDSLIVPYNDEKAAENAILEHKDELAAMIVEGMMGAGGQIPPKNGYLRFLRDITTANKVLLILDEIQTLRYDYGGMQRIFGIKPDLTALGKLIGGGLPVGAFGGREDIMQLLSPGVRKVYHSGTFNGNPLTAAAGLATLEQLTADEISRINGLGETLASGIRSVFKNVGIKGQVTGYGSVQCLHFSTEQVVDGKTAKAANKEILQLIYFAMLERGIFIPVKGQFSVSTPMSDTEITAALSAFEDCLIELRPYIEQIWPELIM